MYREIQFAVHQRSVIGSSVGLVPTNANALSEARFRESVKSGEVLCAPSTEKHGTRSVRRASGYVQTRQQ